MADPDVAFSDEARLAYVRALKGLGVRFYRFADGACVEFESAAPAQPPAKLRVASEPGEFGE